MFKMKTAKLFTSMQKNNNDMLKILKITTKSWWVFQNKIMCKLQALFLCCYVVMWTFYAVTPHLGFGLALGRCSRYTHFCWVGALTCDWTDSYAWINMHCQKINSYNFNGPFVRACKQTIGYLWNKRVFYCVI